MRYVTGLGEDNFKTGYSEVEWTYFAENVGGTATQLQENCANGTFVKGGQLGYTEVEWTYIGDNLTGASGPGGTSYMTENLDSRLINHDDFLMVNNVSGASGPGGTSFFTENADGYTEVEWTYIGDNLIGTPGPGGSTFTTGYSEAISCEDGDIRLGQFGHEADHFTNFAMPVGDFI